MEEHLETLRNENKKLRGKHNELELNLTEEKEMVKYLHGVIKNYQQLLKTPETTRHLKTSSLKKRDRCSTVRRHTREVDTEDIFVNTDSEMSSDYTKDTGTEGKVLQSCKFAENNCKETVGVNKSNYKTTDSININSQVRSNEKSSSRTVIPDNSKKDHAWVSQLTTLQNAKGKRSDQESGSNVREQSVSPSVADMISQTRPKFTETGNILQEMAEMLDSMMAKAIMHENALKQKDKHLKRMERRYEYLASIALGEESEWL